MLRAPRGDGCNRWIEYTAARSLNFPVMAKVVVKKAAPRMTELFRRAFERAAEELPEYEQDEFANWLLRTLESDEKRWDAAFAQYGRVLDGLEAQALEYIKAGSRLTTRSGQALNSHTT